MANEPIVPEEYLSGTTVVDLGDVRVARGLTRRPATICRHARLHYDAKERRIWCPDCERDIDPFDAFTHILDGYDASMKRLHARAERVKEAEAFSARSIAARTLDEAWRSRSMVPACPACGNGLFPEDFRARPAMLGRDFARARRGISPPKREEAPE
jgi:Zn finger protein HypA/HybF involved in hydrogenase expression